MEAKLGINFYCWGGGTNFFPHCFFPQFDKSFSLLACFVKDKYILYLDLISYVKEKVLVLYFIFTLHVYVTGYKESFFKKKNYLGIALDSTKCSCLSPACLCTCQQCVGWGIICW